MSDINSFQFVPVVSITELPASVNNNTFQFDAIISVTEPNTTNQMHQFSAVISVSPGKPHRHSPFSVYSRGPVNLLKDMPVSGRKN